MPITPQCIAKRKQFSSTYQPAHNGRPPGPSIVTEIKKILEKKIDFEDPETHERIKGKIAHVIGLRHILNACQGEHNAIVDIIDRMDGKTAQKIQGEGFADVKIIIVKAKEKSPGEIRDICGELPAELSGK